MPLSDVAVDRAIALMRDIEAYKRNRMQELQWQAENFNRNQHVGEWTSTLTLRVPAS